MIFIQRPVVSLSVRRLRVCLILLVFVRVRLCLSASKIICHGNYVSCLRHVCLSVCLSLSAPCLSAWTFLPDVGRYPLRNVGRYARSLRSRAPLRPPVGLRPCALVFVRVKKNNLARQPKEVCLSICLSVCHCQSSVYLRARISTTSVATLARCARELRSVPPLASYQYKRIRGQEKPGDAKRGQERRRVARRG